MSTDITRQLPNDEYQAAVGANSPTAANPFATIADTGGGAFTPTINGTNIVEVTQESDFGTAVGSNIFLTANTTYFVRGVVTITTRLACIAENVEIKGFDRNQDELIWAGPVGESLINPANVNFGLENLKFSSTVPGTSILTAYNINAGAFNEGRTKVLSILNCQFRGTYDVMDIIGYDLVDINNTLFFYIKATNFGLRFEDTSKIQLSSCELIRWFDETTIPTPGGWATVSMIELKANNIASLLPDYSQTATVKYDVFANQGIINSTSGVVGTLSSNVTATNTAVGIQDVNTGGSAATQAAVRFAVDTAGVATYNGTKQIYCSIHASVTIDSTGNDGTYQLSLWKDSGSGYVLLPGSEVEQQFDGAGGFSLDVGTVAINYGTLFNNADKVVIRIEKVAGTASDCTVRDFQLVIRE
jgi:hypothetical protein